MRTTHLLAASLCALLAGLAAAPASSAKEPAKAPAKIKAPSKAELAADKAAHDEARQGEAEFKALYKELIEINTTLSVGSCTQAATAMKARLAAAGYPESDLHLIVPPGRPKDGNLVAVLPGSDASQKAILLLAHIDVVEANRADWVRDPFKLTEDNGFYYARGASDDKAMASIFADLMARFKKSGFKPKRTVKMALTCGEETPNTFNGAHYLTEHELPLISAAFALNEGGGGRMDGKTGKYQLNGVEAGEKIYQDMWLEVTNPGGHSSRPMPDNAIYHLSSALLKIQQMDFPVEFNDASRGYFAKMGEIEGGALGNDMIAASKGDQAAITRLKKDVNANSILHTNCVATQINGGHAPNALPQRATANVNCRIFPGHSQEEIRKQIEQAIGDAQVKVTLRDPPETVSPPPKLIPEVMGPIETLSAKMFPGVPVVPTMASGATDGRFLTPAGIPTYGVSGIFSDPAKTNAHGLNESVRVQSLLEGREFLYRLTKMYAGGK